MRKARAAIGLAAAVAVFCACSSSGSRPAGRAKSGAAPRGLPAFYEAPDPAPDVPPGTLFKSEKVPPLEQNGTAAPLRGTAYRVMYASRSLQDKAVVVTGVVIVPERPAPAGGRPVVTWAHGSTGLADRCAPSISLLAAPQPTNALLDRGWVVAATDYVGQGTPGVMPYLGGVSEARNVIDIVRAARHLLEAHATSDYTVWGYSQGGQAAMFALDIGARYAPELRQRGVVAGAPPSQFRSLWSYLKTSDYSHYLLMLLVGLNAEYGDKAAPLDQVLKPSGIALVPTIRETCLSLPERGFFQPVDQLLRAKLAGVSIPSTLKADPFTIPKWRRILDANDPQNLKPVTKTPLLIVHGGSDEQVPTASSQVLMKQQCAIGNNIERWVYPGQSHGSTQVVSVPDVTQWIGDRFAGDPVPDPFVPKALPGVASTHCPA
jgi:pimeloyl-ACP methyl ester carboxylesterase